MISQLLMIFPIAASKPLIIGSDYDCEFFPCTEKYHLKPALSNYAVLPIVIDDGYTQIPNPFVEYDSIENAKKAISFDFVYPTKLPKGYKIDTISTMEDNFIQIFYKNGEKEINYRMALGNNDISGDYNVYKNIEKININDLDVTVRKNDDTLSAIWTKGDNTFSIFSNDKISQEELIEIISSIQ